MNQIQTLDKPNALPNALTVARQRISECNPEVSSRGLVVKNASDALFAAELFIAGGHKGFRNPAEMAMAIIAGASLGMGADQAIQAFAVINGKVCMYGDALPSQMRKTNELKHHAETPSGSLKDGTRSWTVEITRVQKLVNGDFGETTYKQTFSIADAKNAGLWGKSGPWTQYPDRMLQMRARAFCVRDSFPDALKGVGVVEEHQDYNQRPPATNAAPREIDGSRVKGLAESIRNAEQPSALQVPDEAVTESDGEYIDTEAEEIVDEPQNELKQSDDGFADEMASLLPDP